MTWEIWVFVAFLVIVVFGLGCIFARATLKKRGEDKLFTNERANAVLAIFFTLVALGVAVDTVYLQINFNRYTKGQVECNTRQLKSNNLINREQQTVSETAEDFNIALQEYLDVASHEAVVKADDPSYIRLQQSLSDLSRERLKMIQTYADNPIPNC